MIKYNFYGKELILKKVNYVDGHTCILIEKDGKELDRLTTNFSDKHIGKKLKRNEIYICMTPSWEHPIVRDLTLALSEDNLIMCMFDFIRTYNEYYRYIIPKETMEMLESEEVIEFVPVEYDEFEEEDFDERN